MRCPARPRALRSLTAALVVSGSIAAACGGADDAATVTAPGQVPDQVVVFAAASLTDAFTELGEAFTAAHSGTPVVLSFAASSRVVTQIIEGAPADVLASADPLTMERLTDAGGAAGPPEVFATNRLEIVVAPGNPFGISGVDDLANEALVLVVCAPQAPCGRYAAQVFEKAGIDPTPDSFEENPRAVLTKVIIGEVDAGLVYATDVRSAGDRVAGVAIPAELNVDAEYPIVVTAEAPNPGGAAAFVGFVLSEAGQQILADHGFGSP